MSEPDDELGALIKSKATRHAAPAQLRARIGAMLAQEGIGLAVRQPSARVRPGELWRRWTSMASAFAIGMAASIAVLLMLRGNVEEARIEQAVVDNHVRSLMGTHLVDVQSSDRHTVKPWFAGKLDYAPPVRDLAPAGAPLVGGRLDYLGQRPVAALVYRMNQHAINVFVWPASGDSSKDIAFTVRQGFNVARWSSNGMQFWAVSDLNADDLRKVVDLLALNGHP
jgi:anti-sigma factor RsiW